MAIKRQIAEQLKGRELSEYIKELYKKESYIECLALLNWFLESLIRLKLIMKKNEVLSKTEATTNIKNGFKEFCDKVDLAYANKICFLFEFIDLNIYEDVKKFITLRNKFTHDFGHAINLSEEEIKEYYELGIKVTENFKETINLSKKK